MNHEGFKEIMLPNSQSLHS